MKKLLNNYGDEILLLSGSACIVYGISQWNGPAAWVIGGLLLIGLAFLVGKVKAKHDLK